MKLLRADPWIKHTNKKGSPPRTEPNRLQGEQVQGQKTGPRGFQFSSNRQGRPQAMVTIAHAQRQKWGAQWTWGKSFETQNDARDLTLL